MDKVEDKPFKKEDNLKPFTGGYDPRRGVKPKGAIHLSTRIRNILNDPDFEQKMKDGNILKGVPADLIIKAMIARAISGNTNSAEWLAKHGYGLKINLDINPPPIALVEYLTPIKKADSGRTRDTKSKS